MSPVQCGALQLVSYVWCALQLFLKLEPCWQTPGNLPPLQILKGPMLQLMLVRQPRCLSSNNVPQACAFVYSQPSLEFRCYACHIACHCIGMHAFFVLMTYNKCMGSFVKLEQSTAT